MTSEIQTRAQELRLLAASVSTVQELARKLGWPMSSAIAANSELCLGLPYIRAAASAEKRQGVACPKPVGKSKTGKTGGADA